MAAPLRRAAAPELSAPLGAAAEPLELPDMPLAAALGLPLAGGATLGAGLANAPLELLLNVALAVERALAATGLFAELLDNGLPLRAAALLALAVGGIELADECGGGTLSVAGGGGRNVAAMAAADGFGPLVFASRSGGDERVGRPESVSE